MSTHSARKLPAGAKPLTVYIKPSDYCNVGCQHCYLPAAVRADKSRMSDSTFEASLSAIAEMERRQNAIGTLIVWHGGEPLSLPVAYLTHLADTAHTRLPGVVQALQTSLIPYSSRWRDLISSRFGAEIGSSVDFTQRALRGSVKGYLDFWMQKVAAARADGFHVIPGMVPSNGEMGRGAELVDWLYERGFTQWNIDRYNQFSGFDPNRPLNRQHSAFLSEVFDAVMAYARRGIYIRINTVRAALGGVLFNSPGERWGGTCSHDFLVINPDGRTNACPDKISHEGFSNIQDGYGAYQASPARKAWIREHLMGHRNAHCATCPFQTFCRSGCPLTPNAPDVEGECSGYHRHLTHVRAFTRQEPSLVAHYLEATA